MGEKNEAAEMHHFKTCSQAYVGLTPRLKEKNTLLLMPAPKLYKLRY